MDARPVRRYRIPRYPTKLRVLAEPELLARHVPPRWRTCAEVALTGAALLAATDMGLAGEKAAPPGKAKAAVVAPIFKHGEGRGGTGCIAVAAPAFISEEDAFQIIKEELARRGVDLSQRRVEWANVKIPQRYRKSRPSRREWNDEIVEVPEVSRALEVDAVDPKHRVAVEFVSREEYAKLGGPGFAPGTWSSVKDYDFRETAKWLGEQVKKQAGYTYFGAFYDPAVYDGTLKYELLPDGRRIPAGVQRRPREEALEEAKKLLRQQVKDFADWLKAQGAM